MGKVKKAGSKLVITSQIAEKLSLGGSIAVNGVCLTVMRVNKKEFEVSLSPQTLKLTNLGMLRLGEMVNLELPLRADGRLDGHFVLGHVDTLGRITSIKRLGDSYIFSFQVDRRFEELLVEKGSVAIDGISLTIFNLKGATFDVAIIPLTFEKTNLKHKKVGDKVNVEFDILGKYLIRRSDEV